MITREQFKFYAAGKCVYGKGAVDPKHLELYIEGAVMTWDYLINNVKTQPITKVTDEDNHFKATETKLPTS